MRVDSIIVINEMRWMSGDAEKSPLCADVSPMLELSVRVTFNSTVQCTHAHCALTHNGQTDECVGIVRTELFENSGRVQHG